MSNFYNRRLRKIKELFINAIKKNKEREIEAYTYELNLEKEKSKVLIQVRNSLKTLSDARENLLKEGVENPQIQLNKYIKLKKEYEGGIDYLVKSSGVFQKFDEASENAKLKIQNLDKANKEVSVAQKNLNDLDLKKADIKIQEDKEQLQKLKEQSKDIRNKKEALEILETQSLEPEVFDELYELNQEKFLIELKIKSDQENLDDLKEEAEKAEEEYQEAKKQYEKALEEDQKAFIALKELEYKVRLIRMSQMQKEIASFKRRINNLKSKVNKLLSQIIKMVVFLRERGIFSLKKRIEKWKAFSFIKREKKLHRKISKKLKGRSKMPLSSKKKYTKPLLRRIDPKSKKIRRIREKRRKR